MELSDSSAASPVFRNGRGESGTVSWLLSIGNREGNIQPRPAVRDSLKGSQVEVILPVRHLQCFQ